MNRYKANHVNQNNPEKETRMTHIPARGGPTSQGPEPATHTTSQAAAAARPQTATSVRQASEGPDQGQCTHVKAKTPLARGNAVPEVGLELHSLPRKHWASAETFGIRADPT